MSTNHDGRELEALGVPELTVLGKRIELLRIERRMSKGVLAQRAGTSRQQLWRVMTGKSELTSSLCARLAEVLEVDSRLLREAHRAPDSHSYHLGRPFALSREPGRAVTVSDGDIADQDASPRETLEAYVTGPHGLERTFETLPTTEDGRRLKRALLDAVEDIAMARSLRLPDAFFHLRRRVVNDDR